MATRRRKQPEVDSRSAILAAAIAEYREHGRDGVRMEAVAERAGVNKTLVYRHFVDRDRLFEAALEHVFAERYRWMEQLPLDLQTMLHGWIRRFARDGEFLGMLLREALEHGAPVHAELRRDYYQRQCHQVQELQTRGELPSSVEPRFLFLLLAAATAFPFLLPQVTELATGMAPSDERFQAAWEETIATLLRKAAGGSR